MSTNFFDIRFTTAVAFANIAMFVVAVGTSLWAAQGSVGPVRTGRTIKAVLAGMYACGILWDQTSLTTNEWQHIARILGLVSIPAVWILPDFAAHIAKRHLVRRIDAEANRAVSEIEGGSPQAGQGTRDDQ